MTLCKFEVYNMRFDALRHCSVIITVALASISTRHTPTYLCVCVWWQHLRLATLKHICSIADHNHNVVH